MKPALLLLSSSLRRTLHRSVRYCAIGLSTFKRLTTLPKAEKSYWKYKSATQGTMIKEQKLGTK